MLIQKTISIGKCLGIWMEIDYLYDTACRKNEVGGYLVIYRDTYSKEQEEEEEVGKRCNIVTWYEL
jgi:hypothetical protein